MKHIGIVDITTVGACICANEIVAECVKRNKVEIHPEFTLHAFSFHLYKKYVLSEDWRGLAEMILLSIDKLHRAGCDFVIIPSNTSHYDIVYIIEHSPIPVLNMIALVADECVFQKYKTVTVLGTKMTMQGGLYTDYLQQRGISVVIPDVRNCEMINDLIFDYIIPLKEDRKIFADEASVFIKNLDCDAIILGCTELPDVYNAINLSKPVLDTTRFLAHKAIDFALG